jgi:segregation and condensation protein B
MAIRALAFEYEDRAFEIFENGNKYQIRTRIEHIALIKKQYSGKARSLSKNALETLAIIAYRQPITRAQINALRQVDSSSIVQTLKEKELIYASGTRKEVGNPLEYKTSQKFLEVFGLSSLSELPSLRSLQMNIDDQKKAILALNSIEEQQEDQTSASDIGYSSQEES